MQFNRFHSFYSIRKEIVCVGEFNFFENFIEINKIICITKELEIFTKKTNLIKIFIWIFTLIEWAVSAFAKRERKKNNKQPKQIHLYLHKWWKKKNEMWILFSEMKWHIHTHKHIHTKCVKIYFKHKVHLKHIVYNNNQKTPSSMLRLCVDVDLWVNQTKNENDTDELLSLLRMQRCPCACVICCINFVCDTKHCIVINKCFAGFLWSIFFLLPDFGIK